MKEQRKCMRRIMSFCGLRKFVSNIGMHIPMRANIYLTPSPLDDPPHVESCPTDCDPPWSVVVYILVSSHVYSAIRANVRQLIKCNTIQERESASITRWVVRPINGLEGIVFLMYVHTILF